MFIALQYKILSAPLGAALMNLELEDNFGDIVGKAQRGLGISDSELAKRSGANLDGIRKIREGQFDEAALRAIAPALDLDANALVDLAQGKSKPAPSRISTGSRSSPPATMGC